jgi:hypothetical protein
MSTVYQAGFERAISNGGLRNIGNWRRGLALDGSPFGAYDFDVTSGSISNPGGRNEKGWSRSGSRLFGDGSDWGTWTSSGGQTLGALDVEVPDGAGGYFNLCRIDGGDLPASIGDAVDVTMTITASAGTIDWVRPGLAELVLYGEANRSVHYVILDSNNNILASQSASGWSFQGTDTFTQSADVTFDNNSGGSWSVDAIEVRVGSNTGPAAMRDSVGASVANGGSITFTDVTLTVNGMT